MQKLHFRLISYICKKANISCFTLHDNLSTFEEASVVFKRMHKAVHDNKEQLRFNVGSSLQVTKIHKSLNNYFCTFFPRSFRKL